MAKTTAHIDLPQDDRELPVRAQAVLSLVGSEPEESMIRTFRILSATNGKLYLTAPEAGALMEEVDALQDRVREIERVFADYQHRMALKLQAAGLT